MHRVSHMPVFANLSQQSCAKRNPACNIVIPSLTALAVLVTRYATGVALRYVQ